MLKTITSMSDQLYQYMLTTWVRESEVMRALREETSYLEMSVMQVSQDQAQFMAFLVKLINAKNILEIGTFTGYSALAMAEATADDCKIICCDVDEQWTDIGKRYWEVAGVQNKIDLQLAPAIDTLEFMLVNKKELIDFAFIDADKINYDNYYEACLKLVRPGGIIAIDNVFWGGSVADESQQDADTLAIRALNKKLKDDERIDLSIVPIGDGLTLVHKR